MTDPITTTTSREESGERWRGLVEEQRAGRESKRAFCRGRGISYGRFLAWSKRFADGDKCVPSAGPGGSGSGFPPADAFCEVRVGASAAFEIVLGGVVVRVLPGFNGADLARLLCVVGETVRGEAAAAASGARVAPGAIDELLGGIACSRLGIAKAARPC